LSDNFILILAAKSERFFFAMYISQPNRDYYFSMCSMKGTRIYSLFFDPQFPNQFHTIMAEFGFSVNNFKFSLFD